MSFQPSHLHLKTRKTPDLFTADFRPGNKIIIDAIIKFKMFLIPFKFFLNLIREHFIFSNCFLNSNMEICIYKKKIIILKFIPKIKN